MTQAEREAWLKERQTGIGSSDAADLIGRGWSGKDGPARVYRSKVEPVDPRTPEGVLRRGHDLEPLVAARYAEVMGVELATVPLVRRPDVPWMIASNDRTRPDGRKVELKTTTGFGPDWGEQGSADVPEQYRVQAQHQMAVTGADSMDLFALDVVGWRTRMYRLDADRDFQAWLADVELHFWTDHVLKRVEPTGWLDQLARDAPAPPDHGVLNGDVLELGDEWASLLELRQQAIRDRDAAADRVEQITAQVRAAVGERTTTRAGRWTITRSVTGGGKVEYTREPSVRLSFRSR